MRPPRNAGEYAVERDPDDDHDPASMRPPRNAGEYSGSPSSLSLESSASMRPPRNAGEYDPYSERSKRKVVVLQ